MEFNNTSRSIPSCATQPRHALHILADDLRRFSGGHSHIEPREAYIRAVDRRAALQCHNLRLSQIYPGSTVEKKVHTFIGQRSAAPILKVQVLELIGRGKVAPAGIQIRNKVYGADLRLSAVRLLDGHRAIDTVEHDVLRRDVFRKTFSVRMSLPHLRTLGLLTHRCLHPRPSEAHH